jgi:hypothetical protein
VAQAAGVDVKDALLRAREQVLAALARCPDRTAELDRLAHEAVAAIDISLKVHQRQAATIAKASSVIVLLEKHRVEAGRESRLTTAEFFRGGR